MNVRKTPTSSGPRRLFLARARGYFGGLIVAGGVIAAIAVVGCSNWNPDGFDVRLVNDTPERVTLRHCQPSEACTRLGKATTLEPGASFKALMFAAKPAFVSQYLITGADDRVIGCIRLAFEERGEPGASAYLSQFEPCLPEHATP